MADVTKKGSEAPEEEQNGLMTPPKPGQALFSGDIKSVKVTGDVHMVQLLDEIDAHLGDPTTYQVIMEIDDDREPVSEKNPLLIHVHPASTDMDAVLGVINRHTPDKDYGKSDRDKELETLKNRLAEGNDLALGDLNKILRSIIG